MMSSFRFRLGLPAVSLVLVTMAQPCAVVVTPLGCAIEPLIHAPNTIHAAGIGGIGVIHDAVLEHEGAQPRPVTREGGHIGAGRSGNFPHETFLAVAKPFAHRSLASVVVLNT